MIDSARTAADWLEAALAVIPLVSDVTVNGVCISGRVNVAAPSTDLLVLLSAEAVPSGAVAWAGFCQVESFGRPVAGQLNANPA